ncbi:MAG TPA: MFS transporter [Pirellulales bacterium]|jgi:MFS family permease|nr:MFS transporter [Pirellulales bacterium]
MSDEPQLPGPARLPRNIWLLGGASFLNDVASEMIAPLLPAFLLDVLGGNKFDLGVIEGMADSLSSVLKLWAGSWSDRLGSRKGLVVAGYAVAALARPWLRFALLPWHVLSVRALDRLGKGIRTAPRDAMLVDSTDATQRGRAFGFHRAMDHLGAAVGPLVAWGFLCIWPDDLRTLFLLTLVPGLAVTALVVFGLREPPRHAAAAKPFSLGLRHYPRSFHIYLVSLLLFTLGNSSDLFLLVRAEELGTDKRLLPILWLAFHVAKGAGNVAGGWAVDRIGPKPLLFAGWLIYAVVYLGFALATSAGEVWALFMVYAVFYALSEPSEKTLVVRLVGSERTGLAYGWFNLLMGIAALPASLLFGALYQQFGVLAAFGSGAGLALAAMAVLAAVREERG